MTVDRRPVRVADSLFEQLDRLLPAERGAGGEPSVTDFLVLDLPAIVDRFAVDFDVLPEVIVGVPSGRVLVTTGGLVARIAVYGLEAVDGSIDLIGIDVET